MDRLPPQALDSERAVLGSMLQTEDALLYGVLNLTEACFYSGQHQQIYHAMKVLNKNNKPVDQLTTVELLLEKKHLDDAGGASYIADLINRVPSSANMEHYCNIVKKKYVERRILAETYVIQEEIFNGEEDDNGRNNILETALTRIMEARTSIEPGKLEKFDMVGSMENIQEIALHPERAGIKTGLDAVDLKLHGYRNSEYIILAGRPSMGKTAFMLSTARNMCKDGKSVGIFSLEMKREELSYRLLSLESGIPYQDIIYGNVRPDDFTALTEGARKIDEYNLYIDDTPGLSAQSIMAKARMKKAKDGLDIIFIDYIQIMSSPGKHQTRNDEVTEISKSILAMTKSLDIPVVALAQLNRGSEMRVNKRPILADLRDSGSLEQDAHTVHFLFREGYYNPGVDPHIIEISTAKNRRGPTGTGRAIFQYEYMTFVNEETHHAGDPEAEEYHAGEGDY